MESEMKSGNGGKSRNSNSKDRRTVTFRLGEGEVSDYDSILQEFGTSLSYLMRLSIKLLVMLYRHYQQGGQFILRSQDGREKELCILELQGVLSHKSISEGGA